MDSPYSSCKKILVPSGKTVDNLQAFQYQTFVVAKNGQGGQVLSGFSWGFYAESFTEVDNLSSGVIPLNQNQDFLAAVMKWNQQAQAAGVSPQHPNQIPFGNFTFK